jgi:hypothetical protein
VQRYFLPAILLSHPQKSSTTTTALTGWRCTVQHSTAWTRTVRTSSAVEAPLHLNERPPPVVSSKSPSPANPLLTSFYSYSYSSCLPFLFPSPVPFTSTLSPVQHNDINQKTPRLCLPFVSILDQDSTFRISTFLRLLNSKITPPRATPRIMIHCERAE